MNVAGRMVVADEPDPDRPGFTRKALHYFLGDRRVTKEEYDRRFPSKLAELFAGELLAAHGTTCWPMRSEALAVHPSQVQEANERAKRHGLGTRYEADGTAVIPSRDERKKLLRLEGFFDKAGGYGD
jgi:hypothetical protein